MGDGYKRPCMADMVVVVVVRLLETKTTTTTTGEMSEMTLTVGVCSRWRAL